MQAEAHLDLIIRHRLGEAFMLAILANVLILVDSSHDFQEGEDGHVGHVPIL